MAGLAATQQHPPTASGYNRSRVNSQPWNSAEIASRSEALIRDTSFGSFSGTYS